MRTLIAMILVVSAVAIAAAEQSPPPSEPPGVLEPALRRAERLGRDLFRHDRAAAVATDAVRAATNAPRDTRVHGWITEDRGGAIVVTFVGKADDQSALGLYAVEVSDEGNASSPVRAFDPAVALSTKQAAQFMARQLSLSAQPLPCSATYNTVVLPTQVASADAWSVYLLPGRTQAEVLPASGHRLEVDADGATILGRRAFSKTCVQLANQPHAVALTISHLLDPSPTELHVFLALVANKALYIVTADNRYAWETRNGRIRFVQRLK